MPNSLDAFNLADPIFVDANIFLFHAFAHPQHGDAARRFLERVELSQINAVASVLVEIVHVATDDEDLWDIPGVTAWAP